MFCGRCAQVARTLFGQDFGERFQDFMGLNVLGAGYIRHVCPNLILTCFTATGH